MAKEHSITYVGKGYVREFGDNRPVSAHEGDLVSIPIACGSGRKDEYNDVVGILKEEYYNLKDSGSIDNMFMKIGTGIYDSSFPIINEYAFDSSYPEEYEFTMPAKDVIVAMATKFGV